MLKWLGRMFVEKVVGMVVVLLAIGLVILVWRYHNLLPSWQAVGRFVGGLALWLVAATLLPWATFFLVVWIQRAASNLPAVILLLAWALLDGVLAWWLIGTGTPALVRWFTVGMAFCLGGLYNLIVANQIANRLRRR